MPATRNAFARIAIGTEDTTMSARAPGRRSAKYARTMARVMSEMSDRMPLQASATASVMFGSSSTLPSRRTGMPARAHHGFSEA